MPKCRSLSLLCLCVSAERGDVVTAYYLQKLITQYLVMGDISAQDLSAKDEPVAFVSMPLLDSSPSSGFTSFPPPSGKSKGFVNFDDQWRDPSIAREGVAEPAATPGQPKILPPERYYMPNDVCKV